MSENIKNTYESLAIDEHVHLRQLTREDTDELFALVDTNRDYLAPWLEWVDDTKSPTDSVGFITSVQEKRQAGSEYQWGIILDGNIVGHTGIMHLNDSQKPEIGYWVAKSVAGQGLTTKVAHAITLFGMEQLNLEEIIIRAEPENTGSNRVAEKLGYVKLPGTQVDPGIDRPFNIWSLTRN